MRKQDKSGLPARGLRGKLWIAFVLQTVSIALATLLGVYAAMVVLRDVLIHRALTDEATHFWEGRKRDPAWPIPDTYNMHGYLSGPAHASVSVPESLQVLAPGFHAVTMDGADELIYVDQHGDDRLWLIFHQDQLRSLALWFGLIPLSFVLGAVYLVSFFTYRVSKRAVSPIIQLAQSVSALDPLKPDLKAVEEIRRSSGTDEEVQTLAESIELFARRNEYFVERERNFTRDSSHELRTPLTIIKIATDMMLGDDVAGSALATKSLYRIKRATGDMEALIEAFLILAREADVGMPSESFSVNEVVAEEVERAKDLVSGKPIEIHAIYQANLFLVGPARVLSVMLSNLLRNAAQYTESGRISVTVGSHFLEVEDSGSGMSSEAAAHAFDPFYRGGRSDRGGHGVGLTIVKRLSDRFKWPVSIESELGRGTRARIDLPTAQAE